MFVAAVVVVLSPSLDTSSISTWWDDDRIEGFDSRASGITRRFEGLLSVFWPGEMSNRISAIGGHG